MNPHMPSMDESEQAGVRIVVPDGKCVTFRCGDKVFEVCAQPKPGSVVIDPGGIAAELEGLIDLHSLDVDWDDRDDVTTFRAIG